MAQFMFSFLATSLVMTLIILGILAAFTIAPKRFSPQLRYPAWVVVLLGLIIPIRPLIGSGLITIKIPQVAIMSGQMQTAESGVITNLSQSTVDFSQTSHIGSLLPFGHTFLLISVITITWAVIAFIIFAYHVWKYIRFSRLVKRWGVAINDKAVLSIFQTVKKEKGIKRSIRLKKCGFVSTSMLVGFFSPVILLPDKDYRADELELIFRHELIHFKRGDLYVKLLSVIATSLHWFNPAVYLMSYAMQADCEASCDEKLISEAGCENNQFYAELIMDMIGCNRSKGTQLSTCFYGGKRGVGIRMEAIMSGKVNITVLSFSALLMLLLTLTILSGSVFAFTGYTPQTQHPQYSHEQSDSAGLQITAIQAREIALREVGGGFLSGLFYDHILDAFRIEVLFGGNRFYLGVDASDGSAVVYRKEEVTAQNVTWAQAMEIALASIENGQMISGGMEIIDGFQIYMFHFESNGRDYEIMIGPDGEVLVHEHIG